MATELVRKSASATNGGELDSSTTQVIPGTKTFSGAVTVSGALTASSGVVGRTDGATVPSGYIGEKISATSSSFFTGPTVNNTFSDVTSLSIPLTPGVWRIDSFALCQFYVSGVNTASSYKFGSAIRDGANTIINQDEMVINPITSSLTVPGLVSMKSSSPHVIVTTTTTYKVSVRFVYSGGAADIGTKALDVRGDVATSHITAVRIA